MKNEEMFKKTIEELVNPKNIIEAINIYEQQPKGIIKDSIELNLYSLQKFYKLYKKRE